MTALWFCLICMVSTSLISLISSHIYRRESMLTSELMSFVSFVPGFLCALVMLRVPLHFSSHILIVLFIKNIFYCLSFYFRYESLRKFGPFVGALMLGTQPVIIFLFGLIFLGEFLSWTQMLSMILVAAALLLLSIGKCTLSAGRITSTDFLKYYAFPTIASTLAIILDRYFLSGQISSEDFFVIDRIVLLPAFLLSLLLIKRENIKVGILQKDWRPIVERNWKSLCLVGLLFTVSVYAYSFALKMETAAFVGIFRNSAYPIAAFTGAFIFKQQIASRGWISFSLIFIAIAMSTL